MTEGGYPRETVERVASLIRKRNLKTDDEAQTVEDVACLVFLDDHFAEFAMRHADEKLIDILRKTWRKMSPRGREAAQSLALGDRARDLLRRALAAGPAR